MVIPALSGTNNPCLLTVLMSGVLDARLRKNDDCPVEMPITPNSCRCLSLSIGHGEQSVAISLPHMGPPTQATLSKRDPPSPVRRNVCAIDAPAQGILFILVNQLFRRTVKTTPAQGSNSKMPGSLPPGSAVSGYVSAPTLSGYALGGGAGAGLYSSTPMVAGNTPANSSTVHRLSFRIVFIGSGSFSNVTSPPVTWNT